MINDVLEFIRRQLRDHLAVSDGEVRIENARVLAENDGADGAIISLINVEEEPALRNTPHMVQALGRPMQREPSIFMNLYILFSFDFQDYGTSLLNLSRTIALFQNRRFFTPADGSLGNPFPEGAARLVFEHHNMSFEALNNLWSVMGGSLFPSVIFRIRLLEIRDEAPDEEAPEITTVQVDTVRT